MKLKDTRRRYIEEFKKEAVQKSAGWARSNFVNRTAGATKREHALWLEEGANCLKGVVAGSLEAQPPELENELRRDARDGYSRNVSEVDLDWLAESFL